MQMKRTCTSDYARTSFNDGLPRRRTMTATPRSAREAKNAKRRVKTDRHTTTSLTSIRDFLWVVISALAVPFTYVETK